MDKLITFEQEAQQKMSVASKYIVDTKEDYEKAAFFIKSTKDFKKIIEDFFKPTIERFKQAKKEADLGRSETIKKMEKFTNPLDEAIKLVQTRCKHYENEQQRLLEEKQMKLEEEKEALQSFGDEEALAEHKLKEQLAPTEIERVKGIGIRRTWKWRLVNKDKIPFQYLQVDEVAINKVVRENQDKTNIPGIEVYYE